jgi:hypothetical protein
VSKPWFRMYHEWVSDPKVQLLAFEDQRHFVALLCLKCCGTLDSAAPSEMFRDRMIAKALGLSPDAALEARRRLVEVGVVTDGWQPIKWDARQYESDTSTERTRAWRERNKGTSQERSRDVTVTDESRTEQSRTEQRKKPLKRGAASRIPEDLKPDLPYALNLLPDIDAEEEAKRFCDYWKAKTGAGATKADWPATWRNWIRNCADSGRYAKRKPAVNVDRPHDSVRWS